MNKAQKEAMAENVRVLLRNFPEVKNVGKLQNDLYSLALKCERNAENLCNIPNWKDQRDDLRKRFKAICMNHRIDGQLSADVSGDPRGYCLKLHLPDGSYNTWGGKESGYGIGSL